MPATSRLHRWPLRRLRRLDQGFLPLMASPVTMDQPLEGEGEGKGEGVPLVVSPVLQAAPVGFPTPSPKIPANCHWPLLTVDGKIPRAAFAFHYPVESLPLGLASTLRHPGQYLSRGATIGPLARYNFPVECGAGLSVISHLARCSPMVLMIL